MGHLTTARGRGIATDQTLLPRPVSPILPHNNSEAYKKSCSMAAEGAPPCAQPTTAPSPPPALALFPVLPLQLCMGTTDQPSFSKLQQFLSHSVSHLP